MVSSPVGRCKPSTIGSTEFETPMVSTEPESNADFPPSSAMDSRSTRCFWALIATQFQGAYSDNILRNLLLSMIVGMGLARDERETLISLVTLLFSN